MRTYTNRRTRCSLSAVGAAFCLIALFGVAPAAAEQVVHAFQGNGDGVWPMGALAQDSAGNLYGTTWEGGNVGGGTVFKIAPDLTESVLYSFQGNGDGLAPWGGLLLDNSGNLYGMTEFGGNLANCFNGAGCGVVFKLAADGTESPLYAFQGGSDGAQPDGNLAMDTSGNLFGTTISGGSLNGACSPYGCGTVFELEPDGAKITLYAFQGGNDGIYPLGGVIRDSSGNLYGTTQYGGSTGCFDALGCGTVFKIASNGTESVLYAFQGGSDGWAPEAGLIPDSAGNLYGTTFWGGDTKSCTSGCGTVFKVSPSGQEKVLYAFRAGRDGSNPEAGLVMDKTGNLYGTTYYGGGTGCKKTGHIGCGTVFKLAPNGTETVLFAFYARAGRWPAASLLKGPNGQLYGTTTEGGINNNGVVFKLKK